MATTRHWCEDCERWVDDPGTHEAHYHDGGQTCWPAAAYDEPPKPKRRIAGEHYVNEPGTPPGCGRRIR